MKPGSGCQGRRVKDAVLSIAEPEEAVATAEGGEFKPSSSRRDTMAILPAAEPRGRRNGEDRLTESTMVRSIRGPWLLNIALEYRAAGKLEEPMDKPQLFGLVRETGKIASSEEERSRRHRARRTVDDAGTPLRAYPGSRFRGVCLHGRLDDGEPVDVFSLDRVRRLRETTSCSKPSFSAASWECAEPSFSMRGTRSFRPTSRAWRVVRYAGAMTPSETRAINQKIRKAVENEGRLARIEGAWWHFSLTARTARRSMKP